jgi:DNA-binding response OmpR family regulator/anti-sigma regulatory factor (Ser/Thr protein kinase)
MTTITIIDDDLEILDSLKTILELNGYSTNVFESGSDFLSKCYSLKQDLILCDLMMPERDGMSVLLEFRSFKKDIPFIFLTAQAQYDDLRQAMINGADDYIFKPFTTKDLLQSIESRILKSVDINGKIAILENTIQLMIGNEVDKSMQSTQLVGYMTSKKSVSLSNTDLSEYCNYLQLSVNRLQRTISKAQLYSQLLDGTYLMHNSTLVPNIDDFISNIIVENAQLFNRSNDLKCILASNSSIMIDTHLLNILISEISENAFKFSKPNTEVKILSNLDNSNNISITISDNGPNTDSLKISKITEFNHFEHEHYEQQALGIVLVKKIAKVLGINVFFENNLPQGLIVKIFLPL